VRNSPNARQATGERRTRRAWMALARLVGVGAVPDAPARERLRAQFCFTAYFTIGPLPS